MNLIKFDYESDSKSPIKVLQYLLMQNEDGNFLMFKLRNDLGQNVKKIDFLVELYNENKFLIEEVKFTLEGNYKGFSEFIPERKLKIEQEFADLKITIIGAIYEKVKYENNEITKIPYSINEFRHDVALANSNSYSNEGVELPKSKWERKTQKLEYKNKSRYYKDEKKNKYYRDVSKINNSIAAKVLSIIFVFIVIAYFAVSLIYFRNIADGFTDSTFKYEIVENNEVEIKEIIRNKSSVIIPNSVNGYTVSKISKNVFAENNSLNKITIEAKKLKIESKAFYNCSNLTSIVNGENIEYVGSYAFYGTSL